VRTGAHFNVNGYGGIFLKNCGSLFVFLLIILPLLYLGARFYLKTRRGVNNVISEFMNLFKFDGAVWFYMAIFPELMIGALLQVTNLSTGSGLIIFSMLISWTFLIFATVFPAIIFKLLKKLNIDDPKYQTLIYDSKSKNPISKYQILILYIKRATIPISLVTLYDYPPQQVGLLILVNIFYLLIFMYDRPRGSNIQNLLELGEECGFILVYIIFGFLTSHTKTPVLQGFSGTIISICCVMAFVHIAILVLGLWIGFSNSHGGKKGSFPWSWWDVRFVKRPGKKNKTPIHTVFSNKEEKDVRDTSIILPKQNTETTDATEIDQ
jgi:hypothetical protein